MLVTGGRNAYAAPTWIPDGYPLTKSVALTPFPASWRQSPGKPRRGMARIFPEHPLVSANPPVRLTCNKLLSTRTQLANFAEPQHTFS